MTRALNLIMRSNGTRKGNFARETRLAELDSDITGIPRAWVRQHKRVLREIEECIYVGEVFQKFFRNTGLCAWRKLQIFRHSSFVCLSDDVIYKLRYCGCSRLSRWATGALLSCLAFSCVYPELKMQVTAYARTHVCTLNHQSFIDQTVKI